MESELGLPLARRGGKGGGWRRVLRRRVPLLRWLPRYDRVSALADLVAGITLGLTLVPQSIAYASLANLPVQYGLYSSFVGTSPYINITSRLSPLKAHAEVYQIMLPSRVWSKCQSSNNLPPAPREPFKRDTAYLARGN